MPRPSLAGVGDGIGLARAQRLVGTGQPLVELVEIHGIVHGVHAHGVGDRLELLTHVAAHPLGVAIGRDQLGMDRLERQQLLQVTIELGVGHLGVVEGVVAIGRMVKDAVELRRALGRRGLGRLCGKLLLRGRDVLVILGKEVPKKRCLRTGVLSHAKLLPSKAIGPTLPQSHGRRRREGDVIPRYMNKVFAVCPSRP